MEHKDFCDCLSERYRSLLTISNQICSGEYRHPWGSHREASVTTNVCQRSTLHGLQVWIVISLTTNWAESKLYIMAKRYFGYKWTHLWCKFKSGQINTLKLFTYYKQRVTLKWFQRLDKGKCIQSIINITSILSHLKLGHHADIITPIHGSTYLLFWSHLPGNYPLPETVQHCDIIALFIKCQNHT